jgi:pyrimidine-specific ribonucleoside hydrolase
MTDVIADVDTGIDDALALAFLARTPSVRLRAVTCVAGNAAIDQVVRNTLDVLAVVGLRGDVPVARGAECPLVEEPRPAHGFHGQNGLGGLELPTSPQRPAEAAAIDVMRQVLETSDDPVTVLALGPLTNVALLVRAFPRLAERIERVLFMGGAIGPGNATPVAEFNAWQDPEAVSVVVHSGIPVTMYGLDVFYAPRVGREDIQRLAGSDEPGARLVGRLLDVHARTEAGDGEPSDSTLGDAGAACFLADPATGVATRYPVGVELAGSSRGQTVVDVRGRVGEGELHGAAHRSTEIEVVTSVDAEAMTALYLRTVGGEPR